jgi:hypothetical protein
MSPVGSLPLVQENVNTVVRTPPAVILNTVPQFFGPPFAVVPHRAPSGPCKMVSGKIPFAPSKLVRLVNVWADEAIVVATQKRTSRVGRIQL